MSFLCYIPFLYVKAFPSNKMNPLVGIQPENFMKKQRSHPNFPAKKLPITILLSIC